MAWSQPLIRRSNLCAALALGMVLVLPRSAPAQSSLPSPSQQTQILQALNRLTWGARPGDVATVQAIGLRKWLDRQLHPEQNAENPQLADKLAPFLTLQMSAQQAMESYPPQPLLREMMNHRAPLPANSASRAMAVREIAQIQEREAQKQEATVGEQIEATWRRPEQSGHPLPASEAHRQATHTGVPSAPARWGGSGSDQAKSGEPPPPGAVAPASAPDPAGWKDGLMPGQVRALTTGSMAARATALEALPPALEQNVIEHLPAGRAQALAVWGSPALERQVLMQHRPQAIVGYDLDSAKLLRAIYSNRQLEDVLTDFWVNHFNIFINKGPEKFLLENYERDAIRPHVLGKFYDLLLATAKSPAMLFYLDNWQSVDPNAGKREAAMRYWRQEQRAMRLGLPIPPPPRTPTGGSQRGINENYGRELMELQTVGVDTGYTQQDVIQVAHCFTGWTIGRPRQGGLYRDPVFYFNPALHDPQPKLVLGHTIHAGGMNDGIEVLKLLAASPNTARHISFELAQRFVADDPPPALVDRMSATYLRTGGDLRAVMQTLLGSPEFWAPAEYRAKVKSPLELVVSAVRATNAEVSNPMRLIQTVDQMGEPLFAHLQPDGYANTGTQWVSSTGLLDRLRFAEDLAANRVPGVSVDLSRFAPGEGTAAAVIAALENRLLDNQVSTATHSVLLREAARMQPTAAMAADNPHPLAPAQLSLLAGLVLGSPEFQHR